MEQRGSTGNHGSSGSRGRIFDRHSFIYPRLLYSLGKEVLDFSQAIQYLVLLSLIAGGLPIHAKSQWKNRNRSGAAGR